MIRHTTLIPSDLSDLPPDLRERLRARQARAALPASHRPPSIRTMAADLAHVGFATVKRKLQGQRISRTPEQQAQCLAICHACEQWLPDSARCARCGCFGKFAAFLAAKDCPRSKWPPLTPA